MLKPRLRGISHTAAFAAALPIGVLLGLTADSARERTAVIAFAAAVAVMFGVSAVYHRGTWSPQRAIILRRFDHANIFLIIAGTYTPIAAALLAPRQALTLLAIAWGGALVGVCFRIFWTGAPRWLYVPAYVALGWVAVFYMPQLHASGGWAVVVLLAGVFAGGVTMSVGMLVHEVSVLVVILNAMRLMRNDRNSTAMAKEQRTPRREGVEAAEDSTSVGA